MESDMDKVKKGDIVRVAFSMQAYFGKSDNPSFGISLRMHQLDHRVDMSKVIHRDRSILSILATDLSTGASSPLVTRVAQLDSVVDNSPLGLPLPFKFFTSFFYKMYRAFYNSFFSLRPAESLCPEYPRGFTIIFFEGVLFRPTNIKRSQRFFA
jgi:hypothetical protein